MYACHVKCKCNKITEIPIIFHNGYRYDNHFVISENAKRYAKLECIGENKEKYITFSFRNKNNNKIKFIDSTRFLPFSL